jgi:hypothetical protein
MLCGDIAVMQAPGFDSLSFDLFSLFQNNLTPSEVDIGRGQIIDAFVIGVVVVVSRPGFVGDPVVSVRRPPAQPMDFKKLHAKNGELALENDFLEGALTKGI